MKKTKITLSLLSLCLLMSCEETSSLTEMESSSIDPSSLVSFDNPVEESSLEESSMIEDSSSDSSIEDNSSKTIITLPHEAGNVSKPGKLVLDAVLPMGASSESSYMNMDVAHSYYQNESGFPVGSDFTFDLMPVKKENGVIDTAITKSNYKALANLFSLDQLASLFSMFTSEIPELPFPTAYTMAGNHFRNVSKQSSFTDDEVITYANLNDNFIFADYANLDTEDEKYFAYSMTPLSPEIENEEPVLEENMLHHPKRANDDISNATDDIFSSLEPILSIAGIDPETLSMLLNTMEDLFATIDTGIDMDIKKKTKNGITDYQYDICINEDGVEEVNQFIHDSLSLPEEVSVSFKAVRGKDSLIEPLHIIADYSKNEEGGINLEYINLDIALTLTISAGMMKIPFNLAMSLDLTFDQGVEMLEENHFETLYSKFDGINQDYQEAQAYYEKGLSYCKPSTTDITLAGFEEYENYTNSYPSLSPRVKQILSDSLSYDETNGITIKYLGSDVVLNNKIEEAKRIKANVINKWNNTSSFTLDNIASILGTSTSGLASYKNYLAALEEDEKGQEIITALNTFLDSHLAQRNEALTTCVDHLEELNNNLFSLEKAKQMTTDYKNENQAILVDKVYVTNAYLETYEELLQHRQEYFDNTLLAYSDHIKAYILKEELDVENLASSLMENYQDITSSYSSRTKLFESSTLRTSGLKLEIGIVELTNYYQTLRNEAQAYKEDYQNKIELLETKDEWDILKEEINHTILLLDTIETDLYETNELTIELNELVIQGDLIEF